MIDYIVAGIVVVPALILLKLRSNAALAFLSLCLGAVLAQVMAGDAGTLFKSFSANNSAAGINIAALILLLAPALAASIITIRSVKSRHFLVQLLPALGVGLIGLLLAKPYLSPDLQNQLSQSAVYSSIFKFEELTLGVCALLSLLIIWLQRPMPANSKWSRH